MLSHLPELVRSGNRKRKLKFFTGAPAGIVNRLPDQVP